MAAGEGDFSVALAADLRAKRTRAVRRNDVVVQREDIEDGSRDGLQVDLTAGQDKAAIHQAILLVEILQPLLRRLTGMMEAARKPLLHPQKIHEFLLSMDDVAQLYIIFRDPAH